MNKIKYLFSSVLLLTIVSTCNGMYNSNGFPNKKLNPFEASDIKNPANYNYYFLKFAGLNNIPVQDVTYAKTLLKFGFNKRDIDYNHVREYIEKQQINSQIKLFVIKILDKCNSGENLTGFNWGKYLFE